MRQHCATRATCLVHAYGTGGKVVWKKLSVGMLDVFGEAMHFSTHPFQALLDSTGVFTVKIRQSIQMLTNRDTSLRFRGNEMGFPRCPAHSGFRTFTFCVVSACSLSAN